MNADAAVPMTIDDVPAWLREHARAHNMRVLFVIADQLAEDLAARAELEAAAWNAGAAPVRMPELHGDAGELFRAGAFAMLASIDHARREADAGNAFAAGYLAELSGAPEHDYEQSPADRIIDREHAETEARRRGLLPPRGVAETVADMHRRTMAVSAGELPAPAGVPTTFVIEPLNDLDAWVPDPIYSAPHWSSPALADSDPTPAHGTERPAEADDEPADGPRGLGRLLGRMFTTTAPERPRCPHCGDRFRTHGELSTHVRDTGDQTERPAHACPVLWSMRNRGR